MEPDAWPKKLEIVFGRSEFGLGRNLRNSFGLLESQSDKHIKHSMGKVLLLFGMHVKSVEKRKEFAFLKNSVATSSSDNVRRALRFASLRCSTDQHIEYGLPQRDSASKLLMSKTGGNVGDEQL